MAGHGAGRVRRQLLGCLLNGCILGATLLAAGCGARWSDEERAEVLARRSVTAEHTASGAGGVDLGGEVVDGVTATSAPPVTGGPGLPPAGGDAAPTGRETKPCEAASNAPGVTETEITIGSIGSLSGPVPGLGSSAAAGIRSYAAYRNATGGVCGRKLVVSLVDDGSDSSRNLSAFKELEPKVLAFVGGNSGADDAGATVVKDTGVPFIGNSNSFEMLKVPSYFGLQPPPASPDAVLPKFRYLVGQGATKAAVVYIAAGGAVSEAKRQERLMRAAGMDIVLDLGLPLATLSYDSAARSVANSGATYLLFIHEAGASASMARSLSGVKTSLIFPEYIVAYGSNFIDLAGSAAPGATSWIPVLPSEDGGVVPEQKALLEWFARAAPGSVLDRFAVTWWAATKVFADTLEGLPGAISRDALTRQAAATGSYDAAGLIAPVDFGKKLGKGCEIGMIVKDGKWVRMTPETGFMC